MAVCFHKSSMEFHLYNQNISYILNVLENGQIGHIYFGKKLRDRESFAHMLNFRARPMSVCPFEGKLEFSMEHIKQEYPVYGSGDMRYPALEILQENGSRISEFLYKGHSIYQGKPELSGLPATYVEKEEEADTLELYLEDQVSGTEITLYYTIFANVPAVARSAKITQKGDQEIVLDRAMSMSVDLPDMDFEMIELTGAWARERSVKERKLEHGVQAVYSLRGCSSHNYNPFLALKREETTEGNGEVYGFSLVYSGNFLAQADVDTYDTTRVTMGIHPDTFSWNLRPGETFQTPEAVMVYSDHGLNGMSQAEQYLSLVKKTDEAFQYLVEYFSEVEEPMIIVMFGDHQPAVTSRFYDSLFGKSSDELTAEELMKKYQTPFIIWANYDIEETTIDKMSANYLSAYVLKEAGLKMTPYQKFLMKLYEKLPVISAMGAYDVSGYYYESAKETPYNDMVQEYQILQYNNLIDTDHTVDSFFYLKE